MPLNSGLRVLWFCHSQFYQEVGENKTYLLPSWVQAAADHFPKYSGYEIAIAFLCDNANAKKFVVNGISYFPISKKLSNPLKKWFYKISTQIEVKDGDVRCREIISEFRPDIIQVFGTEFGFINNIGATPIPLVLHIQSILSEYLPFWFKGSKYLGFILNHASKINLLKGSGPVYAYLRAKKQAKREKQMLQNCRYVLGRTNWDKNKLEVLAPHAKYFHCDEIMRPIFYEGEWSGNINGNNKIISVINPNVYKGLEIILKVGKYLRDHGVKFSWKVAGFVASDDVVKIAESFAGIRSPEVFVEYMGSLEANHLKMSMMDADIYLHPSHIENSSNGISEAMTLGLPVIAANSGGTCSLIEDGKNGILFESGNSLEAFNKVIYLINNKNICTQISENARSSARLRHNPNQISQTLVEVYSQIVSSK